MGPTGALDGFGSFHWPVPHVDYERQIGECVSGVSEMAHAGRG